MKVFIVIKATSVDYHGRYDEIVNVYADRIAAEVVVEELNSTREYDVEYWIDEWPIEEA